LVSTVGLGACDLFTGPGTGSLLVVVSTAGGTLDKDGYTVTLDSGVVGTVKTQGSLFLDSVATGTVLVGLDDIADNCSVADPNPREVAVDGDGTRVVFEATCMQQLAFMSDREGTWDIFIVNQDGSALRKLRGGPGNEFHPRWTPDGFRLAFATTEAGSPDIRVLDPFNGTEYAITTEPDVEEHEVWSPDGKIIAYGSEGATSEVWNLKAALADGSKTWDLTDNPADDLWATWSPDSRRIAFTSWRDGNAEIYVVDADGTHLARLTDDPGPDRYPDWSPSGEWIVFQSGRTGGDQVFKVRADGSEVIQLTSGVPHLRPKWSPDGAHIAAQRAGSGDGTVIMDPDGSALMVLTEPNVNDDRDLVWSPDSKWLAFTRYWLDTGRRDIILVNVVDGTTDALTTTGDWNDFVDWRP
jgi:TolB protein